MDDDNSESLFVFISHYQQKEFVGQKSINQEIEEEVTGDSVIEVLDNIWSKVKPLIKREILVDGDKFSWAENESPDRSEIGSFIIFHDKAAKRNYQVSQINSDTLRKMRDRHVNVMIHIYGKSISSKAIHAKMSAAILEPSQRDRAGAHKTVLLTDLARNLKETHGQYLSANTSSWTMWANAIHAAPIHRQEAMVTDMPPVHLIHLFRSILTSETEVMRSVQNGLQIAGNLNDSYSENVKNLREEFNKMRESTFRGFDLYDLRLKATEEMIAANTRLVSSMDGALHVEVTAVSIAEEVQVTDLPDYDHQ